jgi:aldehyde dehydrogenase (NAD+)
MQQDRVDRDEIKRVFELQRRNRTALKATTVAQRSETLLRLRAAIVARAEDADAALHADLGKPRMGAQHFEVQAVLADIDETLEHLAEWMAPQIIEPSPRFAGNETFIMYEPRGVVLLLGPWNFPFGLTFEPLVPIIAAGNSAIVKPNELQPATSRLIAQIIRDVFDESQVAVFEGGIPVAEALQELPFDHVFFTGSPAVGKRVMAAAAQHLTSVTLELGGKCPVIVDDEFPTDQAAAIIAGSRFFNGGQICLAADYVFAPRARVGELTEALSRQIDEMFYIDGVFQPGRFSRIVDARNHARVMDSIDEARAKGATVVRGGRGDVSSLSIEPTLVLDPPAGTRLMLDEIFGPVLPIVSYDNLDDVEAQVDATGKPLAVYILSNSRAFVDEALLRTSSGGVTVNGAMTHISETRLPFGGVNSSGMGRYRGHAGFLELSNARSVFRHT